MAQGNITQQLDSIASAVDFPTRSAELVQKWRKQRLGIEAVEPILRFMEAHQEIDYGMPGELVHFVEKFYKRGYEQKLLDSLARRPTATTTWMLNRIINGTENIQEREVLLKTMQNISSNPAADATTRADAKRFSERFRS